MEYVSGGDLMLHMQQKQLSLVQAKFYASEVLLALEYLHSHGIIYRRVYRATDQGLRPDVGGAEI